MRSQHAGQELGYFKGALDTLRDLSEKDAAFLTPKAGKLLQDVMALVAAFPKDDPQDPNLQTAMDAIRAKFKALLSTLGVLQDFFPRQQGSTVVDF